MPKTSVKTELPKISEKPRRIHGKCGALKLKRPIRNKAYD